MTHETLCILSQDLMVTRLLGQCQALSQGLGEIERATHECLMQDALDSQANMDLCSNLLVHYVGSAFWTISMLR